MESTPKLTARQQQVLALIKLRVSDTGYPPTRAEIATEFGFKSPNAAEEHLRALARKGFIEIIPGASRGIRLTDISQDGIPLVGRVAAGEPLLAIENIEERLDIPHDLFHPAVDYLLRVSGMSMKDIGIMDGDLLAVHKTETARNGEVVVARIDDEVTVKRFKQGAQPHQVLLLPENEALDPIKVDLREQSFAIEGLSVGVLRR